MSRTFALVLCLFIGTASPWGSKKEFRSDYEYNDRTNSYYKLHIETANHRDAQLVCDLEGTSLMPGRPEDLAQAHGMLKAYPDIGDLLWIADDGQEHESAEEPAVINFEPEAEETASTPRWERHCDLMTRQADIESTPCYKILPFLCMVEERDIFYNQLCQVYGKGYVREENSTSCYKIPPLAYTWDQALAECSSEGGHLVVINSQQEHDVVKNVMQKSGAVSKTKASWFFHAGFRAEPAVNDTERVFKTIFNETLREAGFSTWAEGEPNNARRSEDCGSLFRNDGNLNDVDCAHLYGFICEKEIAAA